MVSIYRAMCSAQGRPQGSHQRCQSQETWNLSTVHGGDTDDGIQYGDLRSVPPRFSFSREDT